jgi:hypothetical protein
MFRLQAFTGCKRYFTQPPQFPSSPGAAPYFLGVFGLTPFIGSAVGILYYPSSIDQLLYLETVYGCSILSFLGAVHWGLSMTETNSKRFGLSVVPSLIGFSTCLLPHLPVALMIQGTTFLGLYAYERKLCKAQKIPKWYLRLRLGLTAGVVTSLVSSIVLDYIYNT